MKLKDANAERCEEKAKRCGKKFRERCTEMVEDAKNKCFAFGKLIKNEIAGFNQSMGITMK